MSIKTMKKEILELKRAAALKNKRSENNRLENMTDEELQEEIKKELEKLGFKSSDELHDAAQKYFVENGMKTTFDNDYVFQKYIFEQPQEIFADIVLKYGNWEN